MSECEHGKPNYCRECALEEENTQLKARVARLEDALGETVDLLDDAKDGSYKIDSLSSQYAKTILNETPQRSLVEIQADAVEKSAQAVFDRFNSWGKAQIFLNEYADQLRNSVKDGSDD